MDKTVLSRIKQQDVKALALDTSIVEAHGFAFTSGLLEQVARLRACGVTVLLPDIVAKEIEMHLRVKVIEATGTLLAAARKANRLGVLSVDKLVERELQGVAQAVADVAVERADQSLSSWIDSIGIEVVDADDYVQVSELTMLYFEGNAPFEDSGPKKYEFPDAIALLTLEGWAEEYGVVLAVSRDRGWVKYGASSEHVIVTQDLAGALAVFQKPTAANASHALFGSIADGDLLGLRPALLDALNRQDAIEFMVDADSQFEVTDAEAYPKFTEVEFPEAGDGNDDFEPVSLDDDGAVVRIRAWASAELECHLSFAKWDGIDKEYMGMGRAKLSEYEEVDIEALVTLGGQIPDNMTIEGVEVLRQTVHIHLADAEPDWMNAEREPDDDV